MSRRLLRSRLVVVDKAPKTPTTTAFAAQSIIAFGVALIAVVLGICYLPVDAWMRSFLAVGTLFLVSSTFTLAKVVRDNHEQAALHERIDQARVERILAEHNPYAAA